ncbi:MAG: hypothetical protein H0T93_09600, partial [Chloroflexia bacterium]|nr:hypothetical protein [Chloroflexia bacterium]
MIDQDPTLPVPCYQPIGEDGSLLRRYERPYEVGQGTEPDGAIAAGEVIPFESLPERLVGSALTAGAQTMLMGLLRLGRSAIFPGGAPQEAEAHSWIGRNPLSHRIVR